MRAYSTPTRSALRLLALIAALAAPLAPAASESRLTDQPIPLQTEGFPERPAPIIEIGQNPFLGKGYIAPGFVTPTGAVWQPVFIVYGTYRSALQTFDSGPGVQVSEWANRLDLFGNLYLTPTERLHVSVRPLDKGNEFAGYRFKHPTRSTEDWRDEPINGNIRTLFFEGDFGELFPNLDYNDSRSLDYGFAVGRQPLSFQDGIMINDIIDAVGITRSSLFLFGSSAAHVTALYGWNEIHHGPNEDEDAQFFLLSGAADYSFATIETDLAFVPSSATSVGDGLYAGVGYIARFGKIGSTTRVNASWALEDETVAVRNGLLLFQQLNYSPAGTHNNLYMNVFAGFEEYRSAARAPDAGGPLGQAGLLFAAVGLGNYGAALGNTADDSVGGSVGYQMFFNQRRRQINFEVGARQNTERPQSRTSAAGARYQQAFGRFLIWQLDAFGSLNESADDGFGLRTEMVVKF